ncbi:hypothetical protein ACFL2G_04410 [Candidatus Omnitrophota bacterium]
MMVYGMLYRNMKIILGLLLMLMLFGNTGFAIEVENKVEYLLDARGDDGDIALERLSINKKIDSTDIMLSIFAEAQWSVEASEWEKLLTGIKAGKSFWEYLYISQSIQFISGEMLDYMAFDAGSYSFDATTKIGVKVPFLEDFNLSIFEEYSVNLEEFKDEYCETIAEVQYTPVDLLSVGIGWRHTDRIHNFDTDYVTSSVTLRF